MCHIGSRKWERTPSRLCHDARMNRAFLHKTVCQHLVLECQGRVAVTHCCHKCWSEKNVLLLIVCWSIYGRCGQDRMWSEGRGWDACSSCSVVSMEKHDSCFHFIGLNFLYKLCDWPPHASQTEWNQDEKGGGGMRVMVFCHLAP